MIRLTLQRSPLLMAILLLAFATPPCFAASRMSGEIHISGSSSMAEALDALAKAFHKRHSHIGVVVKATGSASATAQLARGAVSVAAMSRTATSAEKALFEGQRGYRQTMIGVAIDGVAVYVHPKNPIKFVSMVQLDSIFSSTRNRGGESVTVWGQLGVRGSLAKMRVQAVGRAATSGTRSVMGRRVLRRGSFKRGIAAAVSARAVVTRVARSRNAIGYGSAALATAGVRLVPIGQTASAAHAPTMANCMARRYPLGRMLYLYVDRAPDKPLEPMTLAFVAFVLAPAGQKILGNRGFFPLPATLIEQFKRRLN